MAQRHVFKVIIAVAIVGAPLTVLAHTADDPFVTDLLAGQHMDVGEVQVWNDGTDLYVKYLIDDPEWCLTETHLQVAASLDGIPQKKGNPIPGQFDYKGEHECVMDVLYQIPLDAGWECDDELYVAAHAVVDNRSCELEAIVYGVERGSGDLYQVDVVGATATLIADITDPAPANVNSPNGLAYDAANGRLYFSAYEDENATEVDLYFWDGGPAAVLAGTVPGIVAGATFHNGAYWYVKNATDDLYKVTFNPDGSVAGVFPVATDFTGNVDCFRFGDIVVDDDTATLYGSSLQCASTTPPTFFSLDPSFAYTMISESSGTGLQLAFGSDGVLYGQSTGSGEFFTVDAATGTTESMGTPTGANDGFTDLASGERCSPPGDETAWGDGEDFPGKNWATYFTYAVQCDEEWPEGGTMSVAFEDLPIPSGNDWDYNDFVADIDTVAGFATPGTIDNITFTIRPQAKLAGYTHVMHMVTDFGATCSGDFELWEDGIQVGGGPYTGSGDEIVVPNTGSLPTEVELMIAFDSPCPFAFPDWDPALVHGENLFFNPFIHVNNTGEDVEVGDPRMLTVPVDWQWPVPDTTRIWTVYPCVTAGNPPIFVPYWWNPGCAP